MARHWPRGTQLIAGEVVGNQPKLPHQSSAGSIYVELVLWARAQPGRGYVGLPTDVRIGDHDLYAPDVWWVAEGRRPARGQLDLAGVPELVVEVRSPRPGGTTWVPRRPVRGGCGR